MTVVKDVVRKRCECGGKVHATITSSSVQLECEKCGKSTKVDDE